MEGIVETSALMVLDQGMFKSLLIFFRERPMNTPMGIFLVNKLYVA